MEWGSVGDGVWVDEDDGVVAGGGLYWCGLYGGWREGGSLYNREARNWDWVWVCVEFMGAWG